MIRQSVLVERGVEPQLEVVAAGHVEGGLLFNASPERDSVFELLPDVVDRRHPDARRFARLLVTIKHVNAEQTEGAKDVLGFLDGMAVDLGRDRVDPVKQGVGCRSVARALRPHLAVIAKAKGVLSADAMLAVKQVTRITDPISLEQLRSSALRRELGERKWAVLCDILGEQVEQ